MRSRSTRSRWVRLDSPSSSAPMSALSRSTVAWRSSDGMIRSSRFIVSVSTSSVVRSSRSSSRYGTAASTSLSGSTIAWTCARVSSPARLLVLVVLVVLARFLGLRVGDDREQVVADLRGGRERAHRRAAVDVDCSGDTDATRNGSVATSASMCTRSRNRITHVNRPGECFTTWTISARTPTSWRSRWPGSRTAGFFCGMMTIRLSSRVAASIARTDASRPISSGPTWPGSWTSVRSGMTGY